MMKQSTSVTALFSVAAFLALTACPDKQPTNTVMTTNTVTTTTDAAPPTGANGLMSPQTTMRGNTDTQPTRDPGNVGAEDTSVSSPAPAPAPPVESKGNTDTN